MDSGWLRPWLWGKRAFVALIDHHTRNFTMPWLGPQHQDEIYFYLKPIYLACSYYTDIEVTNLCIYAQGIYSDLNFIQKIISIEVL